MPMNKKRRRPYARRLPAQFARRVMLCARVSKEVKAAIAKLAADRNMSSSEFAARMIADHLATAVQQGLLT
jgi:glycerol kinase